jgi:photosystem II stability/assembly factor-like uncharacterized protein
MRRPRLRVAAVGVALLAGGCATTEPPAARSSRLVDFSKRPPYVNALDIDPRTGDFLLTTNRGFWRIGRDGRQVKRIRSSLSVGRRRAAVGTFLEIDVTSPGHLIGSGHPDRQGELPSFLGLIRSDDNGENWRVVSRLGDADLHKIVVRHDRLYAWDAVLSALLVSRDGGRTFEEEFTPRGLIIDFEVDPANPDRIVASTDQELFRSEDRGGTWRPLAVGQGIRLAWSAPDALYRAEQDGRVAVSADGGSSWRRVGEVDGEPYRFKAVARADLYLALADGAIVRTTDGGRTWRAVFRP